MKVEVTIKSLLYHIV